MDTEADLLAILKKEADGKDIPVEAKLAELGFDSVAVLETVFAIEDKFRIEVQLNNEQIATMTVRDLCDYVEQQVIAKGRVSAGAQPP